MKRTNSLTITLSLLLLAAATLVAYGNSFSGPFLFDDYHNIVGNKHMQISEISFASLKEAAVEEPSRYRWVPKISFALNYYFADKKAVDYHSTTPLAGSGLSEPAVFGYHLVNFLLHLAAAFCFYFLFRLTLGLHFRKKTCRHVNEVALLAALAWAVHPVQTSAVTYVVQRMTVMAGMFTAASLLFYVLGRTRTSGAGWRLFLFLLCLVFGVLAVFSKENGAMLPLLLLGYEYWFLGGLNFSLRSRKGVILLAAALLLVAAFGWLYMGRNPFALLFDPGGYGTRDFTMGERLLTETRVLVHYVSLLVLPLPSRLTLAYDFPLSTALLAPAATFLAIACLVLIAGAMAVLFKRSRLLSFAIFWFLANLVIESSVIPLEIIFEHRMYLPTAFLILAAVAGLYRLGSRRILLIRGAAAALVVLLVVFTLQRNEDWTSRENVWADVAKKSPNMTRGYLGLYVAYKAQNRKAEALAVLQKAVEVGPEEFRPAYNLANLYFEEGRYKEALQILNNMIRGGQVVRAPVYHLRGSIYQKLNNYELAAKNARLALGDDPGHADSYVLLGGAYFRLNRFTEAAAAYEKAREMMPDKYGIYFNLGTVYFNLGQYEKAIANYRKSLELRPNNADAHYNLGMIYGARGMVREMNEEMNKAKRLRGLIR
ncbi:MAG: tetratricopeptide repeat protein [Deltaproteobacteria bacterium]|jgi:cytochrome c-type biogenesis protein CcmH/NrfG|nr:tetratricopeptide repeat protein [Deltaproteobacteria bacterium]